MNFTITKDQLQKLADYLVTRPWAEVNPLISLLQQLPVAKENKPEAQPVPPATT
jgi:hypothetical protein